MDFPPGPRIPRLLQAAFVTASPYGWMVRRWRRYGDVFSSRFPIFGRVVYVADPALVKEVFAGDPATFHAGEATTLALGDALGEHSLLTLDEERHMSQRKLLLPPFHGESVRRYVEVMAEATEREVASWPLGKEIELRPRMQAITLEVILRAVFGVREGERMDLFRERIPALAETTSVLNWLPFLDKHDLGGITPAAKFRRALAAVDELIYAEIADRRAAADRDDRDDVLSLLLRARHEDGSPMTDTELRDELMTLLTAGHETTATGLAWAFERLLRTPRVLARLTASLDDDDYVDAVVKETLRVRPVIVDVARKLTRDTEVAGWQLPAGTLVLPAIAVLHARPDLYESPEEFRPERFLNGGAPESYAWIPFGGGVRRCIGASFAQVEMRTVLREVLRRVHLRAPTQRPERGVIRHVTVVPGRGARAIVDGERVPGLGVEQTAELAGAHDARPQVAHTPREAGVRGGD
ncbi:MAG: cytochrome family [Thermoleophilaceae bacterium]|nr:cytochrome family [Thermoleophilaceae bacterium]